MSIASSALISSLNISVWPATTKDRTVTKQVTESANASPHAGRFIKDLFAGTSLRSDIEKFAAHCRVYNLRHTLPWGERGQRLLPTRAYLEFRSEMTRMEAEFNRRTQVFLDAYPRLLAEAPLHLGGLFNAEDYPSLEVARSRFGFRYGFDPIPEAGDFRVDVGNDDLAQLRSEYEDSFNSRLADAMREPWERLAKMLTDMSNKLTDPDVDDGTETPKKRYHESLLTNPQELCQLLTMLNVTNDSKLEQARCDLERALVGASIDTIREFPAARKTLKSKVDDILGKFAF